MSGKSSAREAGAAIERILIESPKRDRKLAEKLTKQMGSPTYGSLDPGQRKMKKLQILASVNPPLLEDIVNSFATQRGSAGKSSEWPKSMVAFLERMPNLKGDELDAYEEASGGNFRNL